MNILHSISSMGVLSGGPALSTLLSVQGERAIGLSSTILTFDIDKERDQLIDSSPFIHLVARPKEQRFAYSSSFRKELMNERADLYHIQGIWQYPSMCTAAWARKKNKPYIITLRGMLYPQCFEKSAFIKKLSLWLYLKSDLQRAACLHATCMEEMEHLRNMGIHAPVAVIPNPIRTAGIQEKIVSPDKIRIGYLGRVHPRKRIEKIFYALDLLCDKEVEVFIIGDGDAGYMAFLRQEAERLQLSRVVFTGFLSGEEKEKALKSLSYLVVPSDFENFGNIITEALVKGIPVIASKGTPWEELNTHRCGWWVDNDVNTLAATLQEALSLPEAERIAMGERGKQLIRENYSVEMVAGKMKQLYEWILYGGEKPEFVYLK
ncbi:glycosyltransferase [uncultured Parabacteroides sp.]|uniref:glycosyltransferase n=1 Tax=uncultured Parabacteroides sp. TaxID=512312 RepID=UPI00280382EA|nr:glycosyltransferase [uncultured Parabacteroides sp.]